MLRIQPRTDIPVFDFEQSTVLPYNVLEHVLGYLAVVKTKDSLPLVCKEWKHVTETHNFWAKIFSNAGIPLPLNQKAHLKEAYGYTEGSLLVHKIRTCKENFVEKFDVKIDFSKYTNVQFIEDSYVIAYSESEICISTLENEPLTKIFKCPSAIRSLCTFQKNIYCSFKNGQIAAYAIEKEEPIYFIEAPSDYNVYGPIQVLANEKWLVSSSSHIIKKWDRETGKLVSSYHIPSNVQHLKIQTNKLYFTSFSLTGRSLYFWDLCSSDKPEFIRFINIDISNLCMQGNKGFYLYREEQNDNEEIDSRGERNENIEESSTQPHSYDFSDVIVIFDLDPLNFKYEVSYSLKTAGFHVDPFLFCLKDLAILARDAFDPEKNYEDDMAIEDSPLLEFFDLKNNKHLWTIQDEIHASSNQYLFSVFQDTVLYATTDNKVVRVRFSNKIESDLVCGEPPKKKRKIEQDLL